jgi:hypothetical protein
MITTSLATIAAHADHGCGGEVEAPVRPSRRRRALEPHPGIMTVTLSPGAKAKRRNKKIERESQARRRYVSRDRNTSRGGGVDHEVQLIYLSLLGDNSPHPLSLAR